jgi:hypothetical protein
MTDEHDVLFIDDDRLIESELVDRVCDAVDLLLPVVSAVKPVRYKVGGFRL